MSTGPDVIGVGAVNLDYIVSPPATGVVDRSVFDRFDFGSERGITSQEAETLLADLAPLDPVFSPGGSALNTVASIAAMRSELSVGYVGICGRAAASEFRFSDWFQALGINTDQLRTADALAGTCVSLTEAGERSLLTTQGANAGIMDYLDAEADAIVAYLATASVVLITSFADLANVDPLVDLVRRLRERAPEVLICCDPGAMWSIPPVPDGVPELLAMADLVLVNKQEHQLIGQAQKPASQTVVVKEPERVTIITDLPDRKTTDVYPNPRVLTAAEIVDDTGTGDAFAAGLLWALATQGAAVADGVQLGMALATKKLGWPGLGGLDGYAEIADPFVNR